MIRLSDTENSKLLLQSSEGIQQKFRLGDDWYKLDGAGYEGLSEYVISRLLALSNLKKEDLITYHTEELECEGKICTGCRSTHFIPEGWRLISLERLFKLKLNVSLQDALQEIDSVSGRIRFLVDQTERLTGMRDFGEYITARLAIGALFLDDDFHTNNIVVLLDRLGEYHKCPTFDHGAGLMSDTRYKYPLEGDVVELAKGVHAKPFSSNFEEQLEAATELYGMPIRFSFGEKEIDQILDEEMYYTDEVKKRVKMLILEQKETYKYLFKKGRS